MIQRKNILLTLALLLMATLPIQAGSSTDSAVRTAVDNHQNHASDIQLIAVKMDAVWCGKCREMNPKLDEVRPQFAGKPILFVKFDMTDEFAVEQSKMLAQRLDLTEIFNANEGKTGYMLLIDPVTKEVLATLTSDLSEEDLHQKISEYLSR